MNYEHTMPPHDDSPTPPPAAVDQNQRLKMIEEKLDRISKKVGADTNPKDNGNNAVSKVTIAAAFAFIGLKLGAFLFGKAGFLLVDHARAFHRQGMKGIQDLWTTIMTFGKDKTLLETTDTIKYTLYGSATGGIVGPIVGAWIGLTRGDRLENPTDLVAHPIESMKKIFGPDPHKSHSSGTSADLPSHASLIAPKHEGTLTPINHASLLEL